MAYDNGQKHPETDARTWSTPAKFLATLFVTILVLRGRVNFRNLSRYCDYSERIFARQFRAPFDWPDFHQRVRMTALAPHLELISAHDASFISKSGKQTVRSRALLQWLRESCRTRAGDFHTRGGGCHTPVRFRLILPKRHAHYRSENVLLREMVGAFVPPSWAKLVIVGGDAAYGAKATWPWSKPVRRPILHAAGALSLRSPGPGRPLRRNRSKILSRMCLTSITNAPGCPEPRGRKAAEKSIGIAVLAYLFVLRVCHHEIVPSKPWSIFQLQHALRLQVMTNPVEHKVKVNMGKTRKAA